MEINTNKDIQKDEVCRPRFAQCKGSEEKGYDIKLIIEGTATKQIKDLSDQGKLFANLYKEVKEDKLIDCVCQACSTATGSLDSAKEQHLPICNEMSGHPSISRYRDEGYDVIVF
jgi:hypothetical protein